MPYNQIQMHNEFAPMFETFGLQLPAPQFQQFIQYAVEAVNLLEDGYQNRDMSIKLGGLTKLKQTTNWLQSRFYKTYCLSVGEKNLKYHLYMTVLAAFRDLGDPNQLVVTQIDRNRYRWAEALGIRIDFDVSTLNSAEDLVVPFIDRSISKWLSFFMGKLDADIVQIESLFDNLAVLIAAEFAKKILLHCREDIYSEFFAYLKIRMKPLMQDIINETNIELFIDRLKSKAPRGYKNRSALTSCHVAYDSHPFNVVLKVNQQLITHIQQHLNEHLLRSMLTPIISELQQRQQRLRIITVDSDELFIIQSVRQNFILRAKFSKTAEAMSFTTSLILMFNWLNANHMGHWAGMLLAYNDNTIVRCGALMIHTALMSKIDEYLRLPDFIANNNLAQAANQAPGLRL